MEKEVFKDVLNYEGLYQISNYGRVKSLERKNNFYCGLRGEYLERPVKEKFLSFNKGKNGYLRVCLTKNGKYRTFLVHRLVALAFIPNPLNKPEVNHEDGDKSNNKVNNLSWATKTENINHAWKTGLKKPNNQRKINQYDLQGNFIKTWSSITEFLKENNINTKCSNITRCCKGERPTAYGYKWEYADKRVAINQ